jgi:hypothetical protein
MKKPVMGILGLLLGLAAVAPAGAADEGLAFVTVDAFRRERDAGGGDDGAELVVTGVLRGSSSPGTYTVMVRKATSCERMLSLSMDRPGRYVVSFIPARYDTFPVCELSRQP